MNSVENVYKTYKFNEIEKKYGISFEDKDLLVKAFTHGSFNKQQFENYQRLEFLGDSVLQVVVSDYMYRFQANDSEGLMSKERGALVSEFSLAYVVRKEGLDKFILFGKSLKKEEINNTNSYTSDVYEAFVAALYLDRGYAAAEKFIKKTLIDRKEEILSQEYLQDYKTDLQERLQINGNIDIKYEAFSKNDLFEAVVKLEGVVIGKGKGKTKKLAEQQAAKFALQSMVE